MKRIEDFELIFKQFFIPLSYYALKFVKDADGCLRLGKFSDKILRYC